MIHQYHSLLFTVQIENLNSKQKGHVIDISLRVYYSAVKKPLKWLNLAVHMRLERMTLRLGGVRSIQLS